MPILPYERVATHTDNALLRPLSDYAALRVLPVHIAAVHA